MTENPWKEIRNDREAIHYVNNSLPSVPLEIYAARFKAVGINNRESWWFVDYFVPGEPEETILYKQDEMFYDKYELAYPHVVKGKKAAMVAIKNFINPKRYIFDILTHQHVPKGFSTDDPKKAKKLLKKALKTDRDAIIIDNRDFYPNNK